MTEPKHAEKVPLTDVEVLRIALMAERVARRKAELRVAELEERAEHALAAARVKSSTGLDVVGLTATHAVVQRPALLERAES
ncbi:MAG TPA: hypothetical protein VFB99_21510 [Vicinamibacterales bacterium]|nr:hypothetical protein [Vicinamibacterales bacterium]